MLFDVHCFPHRRNVAGDAGRGLVVYAQDRPDGPMAVVCKSRGHRLCVNAVPPIARHIVDNETELLSQIAPECRKMTSLKQEHMVAGRERIHDRSLPRARAAGRENENLAAGGLEYRLHAFKTFPTQMGEFL